MNNFPMKFFDAHTHLNHSDLYQNRQQHLQDFISAGGIGLINIGVDHTYNLRGIEIASQAKKLFPSTIIKSTIGLHPYEIATGNITKENMTEKLEELYKLYNTTTQDHIVAIGEIGIDTYRPDTEQTLELQKEIFRQQCQWSRKLDLPIVIHSRANRDATHEVLQEFSDLTIYFHCRPYGPDEIRIIKTTYPNFYIGFCGNISYPKADNLRKSLRYLVYENDNYPEHIITGKTNNLSSEPYKLYEPSNLTNLLIETDAPYLAPQSHRGKINTPLLIQENYKYISYILGHEISKQVVSNIKRCYHLS